MHKHKWSYTVKYEPEHFGKRGFKSIAAKGKAINLKQLEALVEKLLKEKIAERVGSGIKINVLKIGAEKVLGAGKLSKRLIVEAKAFSKRAKEKIEKAGGKAVVVEKKVDKD